MNYWGYNTWRSLRPSPKYSSRRRQNAVREFKTMVKTLHSNGIEVILDVVYNHTAEGNQMGPTLSFRGIDNASYYRLSEEDPRYYADFTGCGNTFRMQNPRVLQLIMDSLRYWVLSMHVDGFRFDLASTLARELYEVNMLGGFFDIIAIRYVACWWRLRYKYVLLVLDLFADSYGVFNTFARNAYRGVVQYAPKLWGGIYSLLENPFVEKQLGGFTRLQNTLEKVLAETQPDCVVSTYPVYAHVIKKIYKNHHERPFRFITVITDSITVNSAWFRAPGDFFCVANEATAEVLRKGGVAEKQIQTLGFPSTPFLPIRRPNCSRRSDTNRAGCFTSSIPARKRPAKPLTGCSNWTTCI